MMTSEESDSLSTIPSDGHPEDASGLCLIDVVKYIAVISLTRPANKRMAPLIVSDYRNVYRRLQHQKSTQAYC